MVLAAELEVLDDVQEVVLAERVPCTPVIIMLTAP